MKKVLLFIAVALFTSAAFSQVIYFDDFEGYNVGDYLAENSPEWTTWSGTPGTAEDAFISDAQSQSPAQSVLVEGSTDLVKPLGDLTSGKYEINFGFYVPAGFGGYYNIQHFEQPGVEWAMEVYFGSDGNAEVNAGGSGAATFAFNHDEWLDVVNIVDLNNDTAELWVNGTFIHGWQFSLTATGDPGTLQLGGVNMYAGAPTGDDPMYYFDNFNFEQVPIVLFFDDFESYPLGSLLAEESDWWETWSGPGGGGADDASVLDEQALSGSQSLKIEGSSDIVAPLGDKTSGVYEVNFNYYIPSGFGGYYNIQHFEEPGIEWAYEIYFGEIGEGYLTVGGVDYFFDYNHDEWLYIENDIDLDGDWAEVYINGVLIHEFQFSQEASGPDGTLQLGGVNIYAGAPTGETPTYYVDDFEYIEISSSTDPMISVTPEEFNVALEEGMMQDETLTIENVGFASLEYEVDIVYDLSMKKGVAVKETAGKTKTAKLQLAEAQNYKPGDPAPVYDDEILNYDGENASAIGLTNPGEWEVAARFPNEMLLDYVGMELTSVDVFINELVAGFELRIYGEGMNNQAGDLLASKSFSPTMTSWNTITLDDPIVVTGEDLWVGYWIDQQTTDIFPAGVDAGPADPNGDFIKSGVAWGHLSSNPDLDANWNIRALLTGEAQVNWLSVSPESGSIAPNESEDLTVTFDATGLENGSYMATIEVNNNDPEVQIVEVDAMLDIVTGVNELGEKNGILVFPNPAQDYVKVKANHEITNVRIVNYVGQLVYENNAETEEVHINTSQYDAGVYVIQIETTAGMISKQIIVK